MIYRPPLDSSSGKLEAKEPPEDNSITFEEFFKSFTPEEVKADQSTQDVEETVEAAVETLLSALHAAFSQISEEEEENPECSCDTCECQSSLSEEILEVGYSQLDEFTRLSERASELEDENKGLKNELEELREKVHRNNPPSTHRSPFPDPSVFGNSKGKIFLL